MQDHELRAYLGDAYDDTTPEQRDLIIDAANAVQDQYPDPDLADYRSDVLSAMIASILGD